MRLSIIVRSFNSRDSIAECLSSIRRAMPEHSELIVIDDGSSDGTADIAEGLADTTLRLRCNRGREAALAEGLKAARGDVVVNIDSDVLIPPDALTFIQRYLVEHPEVDGVTGRLSKSHPHAGFFSQYKNLYMHFIFGQLPERVDFLYGSIFAVRREAIDTLTDRRGGVGYCDDGHLGMQLALEGGYLQCLRALEVIHCKEYSWAGFVINDFRVPSSLARILWSCRAWRRIGRNGGGFMHTPPWLLASVALAAMALALWVCAMTGLIVVAIAAIPLIIWGLMNLPFFRFLFAERGPAFLIRSIPVTFLDHLIMAFGICWGSLLAFEGLLGGRLAPVEVPVEKPRGPEDGLR